MEISKKKFGFSIVSTFIGAALILVPLTMNLTKRKCDREKDRALRENDEKAERNINEIRSEFGNKFKEKDKIIDKQNKIIVDLLKREDNESGE